MSDRSGVDSCRSRTSASAASDRCKRMSALSGRELTLPTRSSSTTLQARRPKTVIRWPGRACCSASLRIAANFFPASTRRDLEIFSFGSSKERRSSSTRPIQNSTAPGLALDLYPIDRQRKRELRILKVYLCICSHWSARADQKSQRTGGPSKVQENPSVVPDSGHRPQAGRGRM